MISDEQSLIRAPSFTIRERRRQTAYFSAEYPGKTGYRGMEYRLAPYDELLNLAPAIRHVAGRYFKKYDISWHTHANHGLSSQICCLNFLMPLAEEPEKLSAVVAAALGISRPKMLEVEPGPDGRPWFVGFEWNGRRDYLNEAGHRATLRRGANSTSTDAIVRFNHDGRDQTLLIEWKYTESYGQPIGASGNPTRIERYKDLIFQPDGPIRADIGLTLEDFFFEPFYQLLRQQMLAFQMQRVREDGANSVRVLHIAPSANIVLRKVTSQALRRFGSDAFVVFRSLLASPEDFISLATERLFNPIMSNWGGTDIWAQYLVQRYTFLTDLADANVASNNAHGEPLDNCV
jgi:hypothetical protein